MANCRFQIWNFEQGSRVRKATGRKRKKKAIGNTNRREAEGVSRGKDEGIRIHT